MKFIPDIEASLLRGQPDEKVHAGIPYKNNLASLPTYTIEPKEWASIESVSEDEFILQHQMFVFHDEWEDCTKEVYEKRHPDHRRILARPLPSKGEGEKVNTLTNAVINYADLIVKQEAEIKRLKGLIETAYTSAYNTGYMDCRDKVVNKANPFDQFKIDHRL